MQRIEYLNKDNQLCRCVSTSSSGTSCILNTVTGVFFELDNKEINRLLERTEPTPENVKNVKKPKIIQPTLF